MVHVFHNHLIICGCFCIIYSCYVSFMSYFILSIDRCSLWMKLAYNYVFYAYNPLTRAMSASCLLHVTRPVDGSLVWQHGQWVGQYSLSHDVLSCMGSAGKDRFLE